MRSFNPRTVLCSVVVAALLVGSLLAGSAAAEGGETEWDAEAVTKLAVELSETLREGYEQSLTAPPQKTAFQQRERDAAQGLIRRASESSADYVRRLQEGWTRSESEPFFRLVVEQVQEMRATAGDAVPAESVKPLLERIDEILSELRIRYGAH